MRIAFCHYLLEGMGGIGHSLMQMSDALEARGHTVLLRAFRNNEGKRDGAGCDDPVIRRRGAGVRLANNGWDITFTAEAKYSWRDPAERTRWKREAETCDIVLWNTPVPTVRKEHVGWSDWQDLYDLQTEQTCLLHDAYLYTAHPHLDLVASRMKVILAIHPCSYNQALLLQRPVAWVPVIVPAVGAPEGPRERTVFAAHTWKRWKGSHRMMAAAPLLSERTKMHLGGAGIELYYARSKEKVRPHLRTPEGTLLYDEAVRAGVTFHGWMPREAVLDRMGRTAVACDGSIIQEAHRHGSHYNRFGMEAADRGALLLAHRETYAGPFNPEDLAGPKLKGCEAYWPLPAPDAGAAKYAAAIEEACDAAADRRFMRQYQEAWLRILAYVRPEAVAERLERALAEPPAMMEGQEFPQREALAELAAGAHEALCGAAEKKTEEPAGDPPQLGLFD